MNDQQPDLDWRDEKIPVSRRFDDPYFSLDNGLEETRHVFLAGNDLPERFADGFQIAELGFGTGLNFLVALAAWRHSGVKGRFHFTTFEAFPMAAADRERALAAFPELGDLRGALTRALASGAGPYDFGDATLTIIIGDARQTLPAQTLTTDAWFLDGFSPAKNTELWGEALLAEVGRHTKPGGTAATYTAAGHVRRALAAAGFDVTRVAGYGRKRHMTRARKA